MNSKISTISDSSLHHTSLNIDTFLTYQRLEFICPKLVLQLQVPQRPQPQRLEIVLQNNDDLVTQTTVRR